MIVPGVQVLEFLGACPRDRPALALPARREGGDTSGGRCEPRSQLFSKAAASDTHLDMQDRRSGVHCTVLQMLVAGS